MHSSERGRPGRIPGFIVIHDGTQPEVPAAEQVLVSQKFNTFIDGLLLKFAGDTDHFGSGPIASDHLSLRHPLAGTAHWSIGVYRRTSPDRNDGIFLASELIRKSLWLQYIDEGFGRDAVEYRLGADEIVRRYNHGDAWAKNREAYELGIEQHYITPDMSADEALGVIATHLEHVVNYAIPNSRFEQQMGPVGLAEIDGLVDLVSSPDTVPVTSWLG